MYTDYREMLAKADIDAVIISTPNYVHAEQAIAFLKAGKHVFLEKPMGISKKESDAILKAAEESGKVLAIDFELRISSFSQRLKKFIESGEYGELKRIEFIHHRGCWVNEGNGIWRVIPEKSGGMYFMEPVHEVDIFRFFGGEIDSVQTTVGPNVLLHYKFQDNLCSHFFFASGALGTILTTHTHSAHVSNHALENNTSGHDMSMILTFTGGSVAVDFIKCTILFNRFEEYPAGSGALRVIYHKTEDYFISGTSKFAHDIGAMRKEFIRRMACGEPPLQDTLDAWKSHRVCLAAEQSAEEDFRRVKVDYKRSGK
jgi:predicted dehydrogenase